MLAGNLEGMITPCNGSPGPFELVRDIPLALPNPMGTGSEQRRDLAHFDSLKCGPLDRAYRSVRESGVFAHGRYCPHGFSARSIGYR